eukprot:401895-Rhodomonas_salina.2
MPSNTFFVVHRRQNALNPPPPAPFSVTHAWCRSTRSQAHGPGQTRHPSLISVSVSQVPGYAVRGPGGANKLESTGPGQSIPSCTTAVLSRYRQQYWGVVCPTENAVVSVQKEEKGAATFPMLS